MDNNKIIMKRHLDKISTSKEAEVYRYKTPEEIEQISNIIFRDSKVFVGSFTAAKCNCGSKVGIIQYKDNFFAICSKCDDLIVGGEDRELVLLEWAKEMKQQKEKV